MVQLLPEVPSFGTQFARSLGSGIGKGFSQGQQFAQQMALQKQKQSFDAAKQDTSGLETATAAIDSIEKLIGKKGIGLAGRWNFGGEARGNRGEFESLQAAVLPLFKSLFPRGMTEKEFKFVNDKYIPQPGDTEENIKGKIRGLRQFLGQSSGHELSKGPENQQNFSLIKTPNGKTVRVPSNQLKEAIAQGGQLIE